MRKGKVQEEHYRVTLRHSDGMAFVEPLKDSPSDRLDTTPQVRKSAPYVSPGRTFGLSTIPARSAPSIFEAPATPEPQPAASAEPGVIGRSTAVSREYDVTLAGLETVDGRDAYHLALEPRFSPEKNLLRELSIDRTSFQAIRAIIQMTAGVGPIRSHPLAYLSYQPFGDGYVVETAAAHLELRMMMISFSADVSLRISEVKALESAPDWMFDADLYAAHRKANGAAR